MLSRINRAEAIGAVSAALGLLVAFLPWYAYASGTSRVTVNAFRASLLGDVFFVAIAAVILLLLIGHGFVDDVVTPYIPETTAYATASALAMGSVLVQIILAGATGRSLGVGIFLALIAAAGVRPVRAACMLRPGKQRKGMSRVASERCPQIHEKLEAGKARNCHSGVAVHRCAVCCERALDDVAVGVHGHTARGPGVVLRHIGVGGAIGIPVARGVAARRAGCLVAGGVLDEAAIPAMYATATGRELSGLRSDG